MIITRWGIYGAGHEHKRGHMGQAGGSRAGGGCAEISCYLATFRRGAGQQVVTKLLLCQAVPHRDILPVGMNFSE